MDEQPVDNGSDNFVVDSGATTATPDAASDFIFNDDLTVVDVNPPAATTQPDTTTPPTEPVATSTDPATDTTTPPAVDPVTDEADPWESLELDDVPVAEATPEPTAVATELTELAKLIGLESLPETAEARAAAFRAEIDRQVQIATHPPIVEIASALALSDRDLVQADLEAHRTKYDTDASIQVRLDELEGEERLTAIATDLRTELAGKRDQIKAQQEQALKDQSQALIDAQQQLSGEVAKLTDPLGKPLPDKIKDALNHYYGSFRYMEDFLNKDFAWHANNMLRMHPKIGPAFVAQEQKLLQTKGETNIIKQLEQDTPQLGGGAALPTQVMVGGADDFYFN